ncbi:MAG: GNAT family N-acetyltransferase [Caulobacteraceae bacterium]|nr:GNAT family N-acetyltransferase [Caulobacteraceae bacterium]
MTTEYSVRAHGAISDIGREAWDACAASFANPFVTYDFLQACEESGCATARQGWAARHLTVENAQGRILGVMPLYLKSHSQGEYVFDHGWADAYERAGGQYYPKLLSAAPFTPVTGPRLLSAEPPVRQALLAAAVQFTGQMGASSLHVNFPLESEWKAMTAAGLLAREDVQYWWENAGYSTFDDFLAALSSSHRKTIRRERRDAQAGVEIQIVTGAEITEDHWDAFFAFYMDTGERKWGRPYLNRLFFSLIGERMADRIALVMARRDGRWIAGALNFIGGETLYGRQWGAIEHRPFLHFELCYYQAIDFAISRGLKRVEAGAQGQHKLARGYLPRPVYSAHWIEHPGLRAAVAEYLSRERPAVEAEMGMLEAELSPFRQA